MIRKPPLLKAKTALRKPKKNKIKYGEKRFSIWRMEFLHPAMWHDHDIDDWFRQVTAPCNATHGSGMTCHWIHQVAAPCNVAGGSGWHASHIGILLLVSISVISPQSTCHSAPVCEIVSKSDHPRQEKMTSCRFLRWRISAILDFRGPIIGCLKSPRTTSYRSSIETMALNCLVFEKTTLYFGDRRTDGQARCMKPLSLSQAAA